MVINNMFTNLEEYLFRAMEDYLETGASIIAEDLSKKYEAEFKERLKEKLATIVLTLLKEYEVQRMGENIIVRFSAKDIYGEEFEKKGNSND